MTISVMQDGGDLDALVKAELDSVRRGDASPTEVIDRALRHWYETSTEKLAKSYQMLLRKCMTRLAFDRLRVDFASNMAAGFVDNRILLLIPNEVAGSALLRAEEWTGGRNAKGGTNGDVTVGTSVSGNSLSGGD